MSKGSPKQRHGATSSKPAGPSGASPGPNPSVKPTGSKPTGSRGTTRRKKGGVNWVWVIAGVGAAALLGALILNIAREVQVIAGVQTYGPFPANMHVDGEVTYPQTPGVGGEHRATWQNCGIYNDPVAEELAVHAMEHGAVWITYRPDMPADQVEQLKGLVRGKSYTLLSPFPDQPTAVAASAWGLQLTAESADDGRLGQFVSKYRQGAQTPEPGAACVGGVGSPDE